METNNRGKWTGRLGFILAAAGSAVGLGNLWKFPYITYENGGGVFILVYLVCIALVGVPIMVSEVLLGKLAQKNPVGTYKKLSPKSPFILTGYLGVFTGFLILSFYAIVSGWTIEYLIRSVDGNFFQDSDQRVIEFRQEQVLNSRFKKYLKQGETGATGADKLVAAIAVNLPAGNKAALAELTPGDKIGFVQALTATPKAGDLFTDKNLCYLQTNDKAWSSYQSKIQKTKQKSQSDFFNQKGLKSAGDYRTTLQQNYPGKQTEWRQSYKDNNIGPLVETSYSTFLESKAGYKFRSRLLELRLVKNLGEQLTPKQIIKKENKLATKRRSNKFKNTADCIDYYTAYLIPTGNIALKKEQIEKEIPAAKKEAYLNSLEFGAEFGNFIGNDTREIVFQLMILLLCAFVVLGGVQAGIQRASQIFMPVLMLLMVVVAADGIYSDSEGKGLGFLLNWDLSKMTGQGALDALGHAFFTLSLGMGAMLTYGSYLSKDIDVWKSSISIVILDTGVAFLACLMIFPIIFSQDLSVSQSIGMLFTVIPQQLLSLPGGEQMVTAFYVLVGLAALTSAISLLEVMVSFLVDEFQITRPKATLLATSVTFAAGIPQVFDMGLLDIADRTVNVLLPLGGLLTAIYAGWFLDKILVSGEFKAFGYSERTIAIYVWCNRILAPSLVVVVIGYMVVKGFGG